MGEGGGGSGGDGPVKLALSSWTPRIGRYNSGESPRARRPASEENPMNTRDATLAKVRELDQFGGGKPARGERGRFGDVFNPTTGALAGRVPLASKAEAERAIAVAKEAFAGWSETSPLTRARVMFRFKELIERHMDELALLIASEQGKGLSDAKGSIQRGLEWVEFAFANPHRMT